MAVLQPDLLTPSSTLVLLLGLVGVYLLLSTVRAWYRLRHIPGPFLASFSYFTPLRIGLGPQHGIQYQKINDKYGPLARVGPNDLITDDPDIIKRMNAARSKYVRSNHYLMGRFHPAQDSSFTLMESTAHDRRKAQTAAGYSGRDSPSLESKMDMEIAWFVDLIRRKYISTETEFRPMDLATKAFYFTLDVIGRVAYGTDLGHLKTDSDVHGYIHFLHGAMTSGAFAVLGEIPWLTSLIFSRFVIRFLGPKPTDKKGLGKIMGIASQLMQERFGPDAKDERDMLGSFIRHGMTAQQCEGEILFQIAAGTDTTANMIRGTMLHLMTAPHIYAGLQKEIDTAIVEGRISSPVTFHEAQRLEYLQAVIYEALRINTIISALFIKQVPPEGDNLNGQFIPGGTRIGTNIIGFRRSKAVFGQDADMFRPERWLNTTPQKKSEMVHAVELIFGYGRWGCSGKQVALLNSNKIFVELLRNFDFQLIDPKNPVKILDHGGVVYEDMWVRVTERRAGKQ